MTDSGISGGRTCVSGNNGINGGRKCMSVIKDGRTCMLGVNGSRTSGINLSLTFK